LTVAITLFVVAALGIAVLELPKLRRAPSESATTAARAATLNAQGPATVEASVAVAPERPVPKPLQAAIVRASATDAGVTLTVPPTVVQSVTKNKSSNTSEVSAALATNSATSGAAQGESTILDLLCHHPRPSAPLNRFCRVLTISMGVSGFFRSSREPWNGL